MPRGVVTAPVRCCPSFVGQSVQVLKASLSALRPILIVDGDAPLRTPLAEHLVRHAEFAPHQAGSAAEAKILWAGG